MTGQTIAIDLDEGGFDLFVTLSDVLTRRAIFVIERILDNSLVTKAEVQTKESPIRFELAKLSKESKVKLEVAIIALVLSLIVLVMLYFEVRRYKKVKRE